MVVRAEFEVDLPFHELRWDSDAGLGIYHQHETAAIFTNNRTSTHTQRIQSPGNMVRFIPAQSRDRNTDETTGGPEFCWYSDIARCTQGNRTTMVLGHCLHNDRQSGMRRRLYSKVGQRGYNIIDWSFGVLTLC